MEDAFQINQKTRRRRNDQAVQGTNDSSILSKISTTQYGYFDDDFLKFFGTKIIRRSPLVNRGYYIRAKLIDFVVKEFLNNLNGKMKKNQIVNLGAGFDSTFFRLKSLNLLTQTLFIEIDFPDVINRKISSIKSNEKLFGLCSDLTKIQDINGNVVYTSAASNLVLIGIDMRNTKLLETLLTSLDRFSDTCPTLLLSEVVLTYMAVNSCNQVIKWIQEMFSNCMVVVYEQVNPFDGFGQVMFSHFKKLGSPLKCILKYPTDQSQIVRYRSFRYDDCFTIKASDFYKDFINDEEKLRIDKLELFDEYEPWHLKCSHYILLIATNGDFCSSMIQNLFKDHNFKTNSHLTSQILSNNLDQTRNNFIKIKEFPVKFGVRFGHTLSCLKSKLFIVGGFGELANDMSGKHLRLPQLEVVDLNTFSLSIIEETNKLIGDRIFHFSSIWKSKSDNGNESILISFGRSNPSKLYDTIIKIKILDEQDPLTSENISIETIKPIVTNENEGIDTSLARFRHSTCTNSDKNKLFIYGGKYFDDTVMVNVTLNDFYVMEQFDDVYHFKKIQINESICKARHSHHSCFWNGYVIISGGCDQNENPLDDIFLVDPSKNYEIRKLILNNGSRNILPRYSHTSHVVDNYLILIGGVNYNDKPPGICFVDLINMVSYEFDLPFEISEANPLIAVSHQTHMLDRNTILFVGGGAICFTFGNHLNRQAFLIDLSECWSEIESERTRT